MRKDDRCPERDESGHRCTEPVKHRGAHKAFGHEFWAKKRVKRATSVHG